MKPLVLACSPRKGGNTDIIAEAIRENFDIDLVHLRDLSYAPCNACDTCDAIKECVHVDDATTLYADIEHRDTILIVAPVYFYSFDAHTKAFIDRAQYMWSKPRNKDSNRRVYLIGVGGQRLDDNFYPMERTTHSFALTIGAKYMGGLFFRGIDAIGDIKEGDNLAKVIDYANKIFSE